MLLTVPGNCTERCQSQDHCSTGGYAWPDNSVRLTHHCLSFISPLSFATSSLALSIVSSLCHAVNSSFVRCIGFVSLSRYSILSLSLSILSLDTFSISMLSTLSSLSACVLHLPCPVLLNQVSSLHLSFSLGLRWFLQLSSLISSLIAPLIVA